MNSFLNDAFKAFHLLTDKITEGGATEVYKLIFATQQFPFWSTIQAVWSCYVVHRSCRKKCSSSNWLQWVFLKIRNFILAFLITFSQRELFAFLFQKPSPLMRNHYLFYVFVGVFISMQILYPIVNFFYIFLGMLQGANQMRFFTLILRSVKGLDNVQIVPLAIFFGIMDQFIEFFLRPLLSGVQTKMSNEESIATTSFFFFLYWLVSNKILIEIKIDKIHLTLLTVATLALFNASRIIFEFFNTRKSKNSRKFARRARRKNPTKKDNKHENNTEKDGEKQNDKENGNNNTSNDEDKNAKSENEDNDHLKTD
ncbi:hypothetical protein TRFO_11222 [Tritrichomonas foetus]|uniref:Uncharacterized protein n=1 Tax=Tritrichomonas foetus TaxID=1144522 RepID=A0A1J4JA82_9EUKA|nr:hypothetical protein TRFO_11222 [Tritrichomonas foetus]|eukprot:OHS94357.1 hypothetical protein TRFO_11222 [Tritrichomonas foetus]